MTKARFKAEAVAAFKRANPNVEATITWAFVGPVVPYPSSPGTFRNGHFHVEAPGFRTRTVFASYDFGTGRMSVR